MNTKSKRKNSRNYLSDNDYSEIIQEVHYCLNLTTRERFNLERGAVARFIAEIPYMAYQSTPGVTAAFNLISYITGSRNRDFFAQRKDQSISERIDTYIHGSDGKREVIQLCKDILEEVSLFDHKNDLTEDLKNNHPNPLIRGEIDFDTERRRLALKKLTYNRSVRNLVENSYKGVYLSTWWKLPPGTPIKEGVEKKL